MILSTRQRLVDSFSVETLFTISFNSRSVFLVEGLRVILCTYMITPLDKVHFEKKMTAKNNRDE